MRADQVIRNRLWFFNCLGYAIASGLSANRKLAGHFQVARENEAARAADATREVNGAVVA